MMPSTLYERFRAVTPAALAGYPKNTPVLLALSGGADSRALLHLLCRAAEEDGFPLSVAHVDHGIRGEEARRDCRFCRELAQRCGCRFHLLELDLPTLARAHGHSLEEEGHLQRYEFFARVMEKEHIPLLATAHHADDNLETLLLHLSRGAGLSGLCGIRPTRPFGGGALTRPLLEFSREELLEFCREEGLEFVTDSTNGEPICARNRIRGELLPLFSSLQPSLKEAAVRAQRALREDEELLSQLAEELKGRATTATGLSIPLLRKAPAPLVKRVLTMTLSEMGAPPPEATHLEAALRLLRREEPSALSLPGARRLVSEGGELRILPDARASKEKRARPWASYPLAEGVFRFSAEARDACATVEVCIEAHEHEPPDQAARTDAETHMTLSLSPALLKERNLTLRQRRGGERILLGGMHRPLRRLLAARGVPAGLREALPLLCDGEEVLWAPLVGACDSLSVGGKLRITVSLSPEFLSEARTKPPTSPQPDAEGPSPASKNLQPATSNGGT